MEYLPGGTLADRIKSGRLDLRTAVKIVADAAEGVHSAHCSGVIHRDIKPSNILVDKDDNVKVTDFGLAKHADGVDLTNTGMVVGTFSYMSPEQASGVAASITKLSDVYCLGATLFHAITGDVVHSRAAKFEMLDNIQTNPTPNIDRLPHGLCPTLRAVLLKALAAMPSDRYESALAFANDLRAVA